ncbi:hypothetical protein SEUCBS140593_010158 [Sporothrix eucalyptigena]|uniref:Carboxylic ester hydrolase n=1 Tax=Sporothrix eucalyptigena TaxID=1812306 RepID=A0ABP0D0A9_9PEZI
MAEATGLLDHPSLGPLVGVSLPEGGIQFRNLLYATIPQRWQHSKVVEDLRTHAPAGKPYDATRFGPLAPQPDGTINFDFGLIQKTLPVEHEITLDEEKCLNLVLTTPKATADARVPVVVFIHGGGFFLGGNAWPQYDVRQLVKLSAEASRPIVGIGINYRLGLLGALASSELTPAAEAGNFFFNDQANALRWIKRHVAGFGGDPENVTIMGESAGAIWMQFLKGEALFSRGIVMSGDTHLRQPQPLERGEEIYKDLLRQIKADGLPVAERVALLRSLPWQKLIALPQNTRCYPTISGGYDGLSWDTETGRAQIQRSFAWCKTLVVGDCELDATAMVPTFRFPDSLDRLRASLQQALLSPQEVEDVFQFYRLEQQDLVFEATGVHLGIVELASDVRFYCAVVTEDRLSTGSNVHVYHFHEPNPFEGPFIGRAGHVLDVAYTLQTYKHLLPPESQPVSEAMGLYVIGVAHGDLDNTAGQPADADTTLPATEKSVLVWNREHKRQVVPAKEYDQKFRRGASELLERIGVAKLIRALDLFQGWDV